MANTHSYGGEFTKGDFVHIHPATDTWMRGDTTGVVERVGRRRLGRNAIYVRMTRSRRLLRFYNDALAHDA